MRQKAVLCALLVLLILTSCAPKITVSTDPKDNDLSTFHPEVIRGSGFTVQPDVRVFTLFAYLNGPAEWSEENASAFSPQREQLRSELQEKMETIDPKLVKRWHDFYQKHRQISYRYLYYTLTLGAPPQFNYIVPVAELKYPEIIASLDGFNLILAEFYQEARIQALYEQTYREVMMEEVRNYDEERIVSQIAYIYEYLRLDRADYETFNVVIVPAPFDSYWVANAINYTRQLYIVEGLESNDYGVNIHEYLHMLMDDLVPSDFAGQKSKLNRIFQTNRKAAYASNYQSLHIYVEENLVRALDHRMRALLDPTKQSREEKVLQDEVANGLVLEDDFYQALKVFEQNSEQSAQEYFKEMLRSVSESSQ